MCLAGPDGFPCRCGHRPRRPSLVRYMEAALRGFQQEDDSLARVAVWTLSREDPLQRSHQGGVQYDGTLSPWWDGNAPSHLFLIWGLLQIRRCRCRVRLFVVVPSQVTCANLPWLLTCCCCLGGSTLIVATEMSPRSHKHCSCPASLQGFLSEVVAFLNFWKLSLVDVLARLQWCQPTPRGLGPGGAAMPCAIGEVCSSFRTFDLKTRMAIGCSELRHTCSGSSQSVCVLGSHSMSHRAQQRPAIGRWAVAHVAFSAQIAPGSATCSAMRPGCLLMCWLHSQWSKISICMVLTSISPSCAHSSISIEVVVHRPALPPCAPQVVLSCF